MIRTHSSRIRRRLAFSMVELLVVMAVIGMVVALAVPTLEPMLKGNKVTAAAEQFRFNMSNYRAKAISESNPIEVRFVNYSDPTLPDARKAWRGYQFGRFRTERAGQSPTFEFDPISELIRLPDGVIISEEAKHSSLVDEAKVPSRPTTLKQDSGGEISASYASFTIRPDSSTNLPKAAGSVWFVTFMLEQYAGSSILPPNFITVTVDAHNSSTKSFQKGS